MTAAVPGQGFLSSETSIAPHEIPSTDVAVGRELIPASLLRVAGHLAVWLPVLFATIRNLRVPWVPLADDAHLSLWAYRVFTGHPPLFGSVSMLSPIGHPIFDPGPLFTYLLAVPVRIDPATGSLWGSALVAGLLGSLSVELGGRNFGWQAAAVIGGAIALLLTAIPVVGLHLVWNPYLGLFVVLTAMVTSLVVASGSGRLLPLLVVLCSIGACAHTMLAVPLVLLLAVATTWCWLARPANIRRWLLLSVAVGVLCWLPPLLQELFGAKPNLSALFRAVQTGASMGMGFGLSAIAHATPELLVHFPHLAGGDDSVAFLNNRSPILGVVIFALLLGVAMWAIRQKDLLLARASSLTLALAVGEVVAFSSVKTRVVFGLSYTTVFLWPLAAALVFDLGLLLRKPLMNLDRPLQPLNRLFVLVFTFATTCSAIFAVATSSVPSEQRGSMRAVSSAVSWIGAHVPRGPVRIAVLIDGKVTLESASQLFGMEYLLTTKGFEPPDSEILNQGEKPSTAGPLVVVVEQHGAISKIFIAHPS